MDINNLALSSDTSFLHLKHPLTDEPLVDGKDEDGKDKKVGIHLYGSASKQYRDAIRAMQNRQIKRGNKKATAAEITEEGVTLLVAVSDTADNLVVDGQKIGSPGSFRDLYENPKFSWLREQVDAAVGDISNFLSQ